MDCDTMDCNNTPEIAAIHAALNLFVPQIKELTDAKINTVIQLIETKHQLEMAEIKITQQKQDFTNGKVKRLEAHKDTTEEAMKEIVANQFIVRWMRKYPKWSVLIILVVGVGFAWVADKINIEYLLSKIL